jgi:hypothetical protein
MQTTKSLQKIPTGPRRVLAFLSLTGLLLILSACSPEQVAKPDEAVAAETSGEGWTLIADGEARGVIYLAGEATPTATYAAEELRDHLQLVTGVDVPIVREMPEDEATPVVLVGPSAAAAARGVDTEDLFPAGFRIRSGDNWLVLLGDDSDGSPFLHTQWKQRDPVANGTLHAVYRFLEETAGVRWFMPGELGTVAPQASELIVPPLDRRVSPGFELRMPRMSRTWDPKHPTYVQHDGEGGRWLLRAGFGADRGLDVEFTHSFSWLADHHWSGYGKKQNLQATKPHIFAELPDGKRDFNTTSYGHGNLCLSHPDTVEEFVKLLRYIFDEHYPNLRGYSIVPNDVWIPCHGECCLAGLDPAMREEIRNAGMDQQGGTPRLTLTREQLDRFREASSLVFWDFVVKVARQIEQSHPDRLVGVLGGYEGYGNPEIAAQFDLPSNLAVSVTKSRKAFWNPEARERSREMLRAWSKLTDHLHVWEYYLWEWRDWGGRTKMSGYPVFFPELLQDDIRFMREIGVRGDKVESQEMLAHPGLNHLIMYLTGRLLYDPELDVREVLEDYYTKFYGAARDEMKAFWERAEACWMRDTRGLNARTEADKIIETLFTQEDLEVLFGHLEAGMALVPPDSAEHRRIALIAEEMAPVRSRLQPLVPVEWSAWQFRKDPDDRGVRERWFEAAEAAGSEWQEVEVPARLANTDVGPYLGHGWYATTFTVPEEFRGRDLQLLFGGVDEQAWVYVNGTLVGEHSTKSTGLDIGALWDRPFAADVPAAALDPSGLNRLWVRKHSSAGNSGIHRPVRVGLPTLGAPPQFQSATLFPAPEILGTFQEGWSESAITLRGPDGQTASPGTQVLVGHDPQNLYLTFRAEEDGSAPLPSEADGKSWFWGGVGGRSLPRSSSNTLMIEIQPDPAVDRSAAILINASGAHLDFLYGDPAVENPRQWQSKARVAVAVDDKGWSGTVAIPWSSLGVNLHAGLAVKANITRVRSGQANSAWSPLPPTWNAATAADRGRERFGTLHFLED